jgi:hypothetical protein
MSQNPIKLLARAVLLKLKGRARLERDIDDTSLYVEGERFVAFRKVVVDPAPDQPTEPGAIFQVRFSFKNLSSKANRRLSLIPIPLITAQPGFRSKTWLLGDETGDFIGYYEFDTVRQAEAYWDSLPLKMMRGRAAEGSLSHEVRPARGE